MPTRCSTCSVRVPSKASFCHKCGQAVAAPVDPEKSLLFLRMRRLRAVAEREELHARAVRTRLDREQAENVEKQRRERTAWDLSATSQLVLVVGYLLLFVAWAAGTTAEATGLGVALFFGAMLVLAVGLMVGATILGAQATDKKDQSRDPLE